MTVEINDTVERFTISGVGPYAFSFRVFDEDEIAVTAISGGGATTPLAITTNYTVDGVDDEDGGTITLIAGTATTYAGYTLDIRSNTAEYQPTSIRNQGRFLPEIHEDALDRLSRQIQDLRRRVNASIRYPDNVITDGALSPISSWHNRYFYVNADGEVEPASAIALTTLTQSIITALIAGDVSGSQEDLAEVLGKQRTLAEIAAGVTPTNYSYVADRPYYDTRRTGAIANGITDNTAAMQIALNALGDAGGTIFNPKGAQFDLSELEFPARSVLMYYGGDDLSSNHAGMESNEVVVFIANEAQSGGIINEDILSAAYHPGHVIDVRKSVAGHDNFLGGSQSRVEPARASYNMRDDGNATWRVFYQLYCNTYNHFSGVVQHVWVTRTTLSGIGTGSFVTDPAFGALITGSTSGAKGFAISMDGASTILQALSGTFVVGETVTDNNETSSTTISGVSTTVLDTNALGQDLQKGNWSVGIRPGSVLDAFAVGGRIATTQSDTHGQFVYDDIIDPGFVWIDSYSSSPISGFEIRYVCTATSSANRRLTLHEYGSTAKEAHIGATRAHVNFANGVTANTSAFNIASIVRNGTGDYTITFTNAFPRADYSVSLTSGHPLDHVTVDTKGTSTLIVKCWQTGTSTPRDLTNRMEVICIGGDI